MRRALIAIGVAVVVCGCRAEPECDRAVALSSLRDNLAFFGVDLSHLDDEELERHMIRANQVVIDTGRASGVSASDFADALRVVARTGFEIRDFRPPRPAEPPLPSGSTITTRSKEIP